MIIILRGISGSGKSIISDALQVMDLEKIKKLNIANDSLKWQYIKGLNASLNKENRKFGHLSADHYFMVDGEYKFNPAHLGEAHAACLRSFSNLVNDPGHHVIVDNTNCSLAEVVPYMALARAYAQELEVITIVADPEKAWKRNTHQAPFKNVLMQDVALRKSLEDWPPWFPQNIFPATF